MKRLSAHRTAALQAELARHPQVALAALVHRLAMRVIFDNHEGSSINITAMAHVDGLVTHAPDVVDAPAASGLRSVREALAARPPSNSRALFAELLTMPQPELLWLLAVCVASTVGAICSKEAERPAVQLADALGPDMHDWWTPTKARCWARPTIARTAWRWATKYRSDFARRIVIAPSGPPMPAGRGTA